MSKAKVYVERLGLVAYGKAWAYQTSTIKRIQENMKAGNLPPHTLLLLEHKPVYTVGLRSKEYSTEEEERLKALGADFHRTNRGGLITFHGPGQLIAYPILYLPAFNPGIKWYVCALERTVIRACREMGVITQTTQDTGVWVGNNKICALGIQGRHISSHGLALNCNIDLTWFKNIVPCGLQGKGVTSLSQELERDVNVQEAEVHLLKAFSEIFNCELINNNAV